jgi:hypothetical protein
MRLTPEQSLALALAPALLFDTLSLKSDPWQTEVLRSNHPLTRPYSILAVSFSSSPARSEWERASPNRRNHRFDITNYLGVGVLKSGTIMRNTRLVVLAVVTAVAAVECTVRAADDNGDAVKRDLERVAGTWQLIS